MNARGIVANRYHQRHTHVHVHNHGDGITKRRLAVIKKNPHLFCGLLTKPKGSIFTTCYIDRSVKCVWNDPPEYPGECDLADIVFANNKSVVPHDPLAARRTPSMTALRKRYAACAEPATYDWTPSCMFIDRATGRKCWPDRTDAVCWWDCHQFTWTPFPLPLTMHDTTPPFRRDETAKFPRNSRAIADHLKKKKDAMKDPFVWDNAQAPTLQFDCIGIFCGPSCAMAYALDHGMRQSVPLIQTVARMFGYLKTPKRTRIGFEEEENEDDDDPQDFDRIIPSPPRELLRMFTCQEDTFTIEEFRRLCSCGITVIIRDPVFVTRERIVEAEKVMTEREIKLSEFSQLAHETGCIATGKAVLRKDDLGLTSRQTTAEMVRVQREVKPIKGAKRLVSFRSFRCCVIFFFFQATCLRHIGQVL